MTVRGGLRRMCGVRILFWSAKGLNYAAYSYTLFIDVNPPPLSPPPSNPHETRTRPRRSPRRRRHTSHMHTRGRDGRTQRAQIASLQAAEGPQCAVMWARPDYFDILIIHFS